MSVKDIIFLKSINPISILDKPNKQTLEYLAKIIHNEYFQEYINIIRTQKGFPENGISLKAFEGKNLHELPVINNELILLSLKNAVHDLCKVMGISDDFNTNMLLLLFFNAFIDVEYFEGFITKPIEFILGRKNISSAMFDYPYEVGSVIIPFNLSQNTFIKWAENKENWQKIQKQMDENLTTDPYLLRLHKNTEIALEIDSLKEHDKLSYFEIADKLSKDYPDDPRVQDGDWVKKTHQNYKEMWNSSSDLKNAK